MESKHVIGILGGAVAGSEAARVAAERGALVVVVEQGTRPYGKIEDGLPRWHVALRTKEFEKIDANLAHPNILYVPSTRVGRDLSWEAFAGLGFSATVLANGAWRDRPLPVVGIERFVGRGLIYQNAFVHWFNHAHECGYDGPRYVVPDRAIVVGGGLASIDVVKIINFELYGAALAARGIHVDAEEMDHAGIPEICARHGIAAESLGIHGATLFYRRRAEDMPLVAAEEGSARAAKVEQTRVKLLERVLKKYLVHFEPLCAPLRPIVVPDVADGADGPGGERLGGLVVSRQRQDGTREELVVPSDLVVSSIGSIPEPIPGIPTVGEFFRWRDREAGELDLEGRSDVFGLGNVLTGKGNIVESRKNAKRVMGQSADTRLGLAAVTSEGAAATVDAMHAVARAEADAVVTRAMAGAEALPENAAAIKAWVLGRWAALGYGGYRTWIAAHRPVEA